MIVKNKKTYDYWRSHTFSHRKINTYLTIRLRDIISQSFCESNKIMKLIYCLVNYRLAER